MSRAKMFYITFGQSHRHTRLGKVFQKDVVMRVKGEDNEIDARGLAWRLFGSVWAFSYDKEPPMELFPDGFIDVDRDFVRSWEAVAPELEKQNGEG